MCHYLGGGLHGRKKRVKAQSESSKSVVNSVLISREMPVFPGFLEIIRVVKMKKENISRICQDTILDYYDLLEQKQFEVNIQIPDTPIFAYTDNEALQRILKNLIDNAIRHGGDGKYISLRLTTSNGKNIIEIEDRGDGISPQQQKQIFERNYTTARKTSGSGLGLSISKCLAEQIGADLEVYSVQNEQTIFSIILKKLENR